MGKRNRYRTYNVNTTSDSRGRFFNWLFREKGKKYLLLLLFGVIVFFYFWGNTGIIHLIDSKYRQHNIQKSIALMEEENRRAAAEIQALRSDLKTLERLAREELGLIKKGEVVYKFIVKKEDKNANSGDRNSNKR